MSVGEEILGPLGALETGRLASLEGSLFEALLALLERLRGDMLGRLLDAVMRDVKEKAQSYCKDRYGGNNLNKSTAVLMIHLYNSL